MTSFAEVSCKCAICKEKYVSSRLVSTFSWGEPDLDLRPAMGERSTLGYELYICPCCGYVQREPNKVIIPELLVAEKDLISTADYKKPFSKIFKKPNISNIFWRISK